MNENNNTYFAVLSRIADALEAQGGYRSALEGQVFDVATPDGLATAVTAIARALGAEVNHA